MDALALLCNLYGDGPATLRRLREAGCTALADLGRVSLDELTEILGSSSVAARRFQSEAALLVTRAPEACGPDAGAAETAERSPSASHPAIERALAAWRVADAQGAETALADGEPATAPVESARADRDEPAGVATTPLRPALVDGLDDVICARLRALSVETAEDLVVADLLELSISSEIALTRLMRIQGHLRRLIAAESPGLLVPHPRRHEARFSPDPLAGELRERARHESEPGAGPFA